MKVSLIIPTKNEEGAIGRVLAEIPKKIIDEIIVIDGHSTDNTEKEAIRQLRKEKDRFILQRRKGFGSALREAFRKASGDVIIIMNADGSHNPKNIPSLLRKINDGFTYVMASRYLRGGRSDDDTLIRSIGNRSLTFLTNLFHLTDVTDSLYFFTAIKHSELKKLKLTSPGFELCIEILIKAKKAGLKFAEVPVVERPRYAGKSKVYALTAGLRILGVILGIKFNIS